MFYYFIVMVYVIVMFFSDSLYAQNIYELRKLTNEDWLKMTTEEHMSALGMANKKKINRDWVGDFGQNYELYKKWGYDYYEMEDRYENYAFRGFQNYNVINEARLQWSYNEFGDRIDRMRATGNIWSEKYSGDGTFSVSEPSGYINSVSYYLVNSIIPTGVDGVWVANEATDDWAVSAIGAGALRTKFTPLTLSLPNMNGMRVDFQSANTSASIVNSLIKGSMLRGGTFRHKFGALTLGATYVNQYSIQGNREGGDSWFGTVSNYAPTPIVVAFRLMDDSPEDNKNGPVIYDVRLKVNGTYHDDIVPFIMRDDVTRDRTSALSKLTDQIYIQPSTAYNQLGLDGSVPKFGDYFFIKDCMQGSSPSNVQGRLNLDLVNKYYTFVDPSSNYVTANGTETVTYFFDLNGIVEHANRVEAEITVANDYRIQTAYIYNTEVKSGHDTSGNSTSIYSSTYWTTMAQAEGNVKDKSNVKRVNVAFGCQVANVIYGFDMDFNYHGFSVTGEYVTNSSHYMYPDDVPGAGYPTAVVSGLPRRTGDKWSINDSAYYIISKKDWEKIGFTGEIFKMGKFYRPYMDYFAYFYEGGQAYQTRYIRESLVEDNDDDDQYPDRMEVPRIMGYTGGNFGPNDDPDGVFPGNDADYDGIPDNNKNNNSIADYNEPFLMFDSDPDNFVFGNDYNNNNVPDFREDDIKYDTPYELDRQGHHFTFRYTPARDVNLIAGSLKTRGVGTDNRTYDNYFKLQVNYNVFDIGRFYAEYRYEKIQDNIRDKYIQSRVLQDWIDPQAFTISARFSRDIFYDELEYKNSHVHRLWFDSAIRAVPSITLENHIKLEKNGQIEGFMYDSTYQSKENINTLAMLNKIVYTRKLGNWTFSPGVKFRLYKKDRSDVPRPGDYYMTRIPMVIFKYDISDRTNIMFGLQGIPGFEFSFRDYVQGENDYKQKTYLMQIQNRTSYFGYDIWASTGLKMDDLEYSAQSRAFENYKYSTFFVQVYLGY